MIRIYGASDDLVEIEGSKYQDDEPIEACKNCNKYTGNVVT